MATSIDQQVQPTSNGTNNNHPYTCLSCSLAFSTPQAQRSHYSTDLHRYNSKRSIAGLAPVDILTFNQKVLERRQIIDNNNQSSKNIDPENNQRRCDDCGKSFASEGAQKSHFISKRHKEIVMKNSNNNTKKPKATASDDNKKIEPEKIEEDEKANEASKSQEEDSEMKIDPKGPEEPKKGSKKSELDSLIEARLKDSIKISALECLFCPRQVSKKFSSVEKALDHMLLRHGFYLPDQDYLIDRVGLLNYLAESISVWNVCIYCGTGFGGKIQSGDNPDDQSVLAKRGLERVRKHMCDKNHCKIAWDTENQRLEYSDFYDYRSSYKNIKNDRSSRLKSNRKLLKVTLNDSEEEEEEGWEDLSSDGEEKMDVDSEGDDGDDEFEESKFSFGDSPFELVLPNGNRIGHRSLRHIYKQNLLPYSIGSQSTQAGNRNINLITRLAILSNKPANGSERSSATNQLIVNHLSGVSSSVKSHSSLVESGLIPSRGGGLNFNNNNLRGGDLNNQVIKARNRGEAKEAGKHIRTFRDFQKRSNFRNKVSWTNGNNQKHYRDPLLQ